MKQTEEFNGYDSRNMWAPGASSANKQDINFSAMGISNGLKNWKYGSEQENDYTTPKN